MTRAKTRTAHQAPEVFGRQQVTTFSENLKKFVAFRVFDVSFANHCQN
jgi:hypothetical protein